MPVLAALDGGQTGFLNPVELFVSGRDLLEGFENLRLQRRFHGGKRKVVFLAVPFAIAFGFGAGLVRFAPGTAGTLAAWPVGWLLAGTLPPAAMLARYPLSQYTATGFRFANRPALSRSSGRKM